MKYRLILTALVVTLALIPGPATAASSTTTTTTDQNCVAALTVAKASARQVKDGCTITSTLTLGAEETPTATDTKALSLTATATATTYPRYCRNWSQTDTTASWQEKHIGRFCYDHHDAYVWAWGGYHRCDLGWVVGWDLTVKTCDENRVYDSSFQGGYFVQNWDYYRVCLISKYLPLPTCFSYNMHVNVFPSGNVTEHKG